MREVGSLEEYSEGHQKISVQEKKEIEKGLADLHEVFGSLALAVGQQAEGVNTIEDHIRRAREIREIEQGATALKEGFCILATLVRVQDGSINTIADNINSTSNHVDEARKNLKESLKLSSVSKRTCLIAAILLAAAVIAYAALLVTNPITSTLMIIMAVCVACLVILNLGLLCYHYAKQATLKAVEKNESSQASQTSLFKVPLDIAKEQASDLKNKALAITAELAATANAEALSEWCKPLSPSS